MQQNSLLISPESDIENNITWLEQTLREARGCRHALRHTPYINMVSLPLRREQFMERLQERLPEGVSTPAGVMTRQVVADLSRTAADMLEHDDLASAWMAILLGCLLALEDMRQGDPDCSTINALHSRCFDLLQQAKTGLCPA